MEWEDGKGPFTRNASSLIVFGTNPDSDQLDGVVDSVEDVEGDDDDDSAGEEEESDTEREEEDDCKEVNMR